MHYSKKLIFFLQDFFASTNRIFSLAERLGTRLLFYEILKHSLYFLIA